MSEPSSLQSRLAEGATEGPVSLSFAPDIARFTLRIAADDRAAASECFGTELPAVIGEANGKDGRRAVCLGPDEWLLHADVAHAPAISEAFATLYDQTPHSLVDISDREIGLSVTGAQAATLLSAGCPIDLRDIAIGAARRTVLDGVSVIIHRDSDTDFQLDIWRSFLPHVWDLLNVVNRELATGF